MLLSYSDFNSLIGTLKPAMRWLVHWPLMGVHLVQRGGAWTDCGPAQSPSRPAVPNVYQLYQCVPAVPNVPNNVSWYTGRWWVGCSPPINGQCTNSRYSIVALQWRLLSKWLKRILPRNRQLQEKQLCHFKENILTTQWKKKNKKKFK